MRYFIDTEFIEKPCTIELLSIGIVSEDNRGLYMETPLVAEVLTHPEDFDPWMQANVFPHLTGPNLLVATMDEIRASILAFCDVEKYGKPEFWGHYADYDWVAFCWIFGRMIDLPKNWPMFCRDFKQTISAMNPEPTLTKCEDEHNAFFDAKWLRDEYVRIMGDG